jgi:membrane-associated phospholipid phosphatase
MSIIKEEIDTIGDFLFSLGFFSEVFLLLIVVSLIYKNTYDLIFYIVFLFISGYFNRFLKAIIKQKRPSDPIKFLHSEHFDLSKPSYGMPSGHSQNVFLSITYLYLTSKNIYPFIYVALFIGFLMIFERWYFHNHTIAQLIVGAGIGSVIGYIAVTIREIVKIKYLK